MNWLKSKWFWLDVLAIIVIIIQYLQANPNWKTAGFIEGLLLVVVTTIIGFIQSGQNASLRKINKSLTASKK